MVYLPLMLTARRIISIFIIVSLLPIVQVQAEQLVLPVPGTMVHLSPSVNPPILKGIKVNLNDPFKFEFVLDQGSDNQSQPGDISRGDVSSSLLPNDQGMSVKAPEGTKQMHRSGKLSDFQLKQESTRLIKYFLAALTTPEKDLWVNLSPYEKDRIVPESFGQTEMGRDLLAQDYILKQLTASLIYPEGDIGKKFWKRVYQAAGNKNVPINTFNKVWIVPSKAVVYENSKMGTAYVVESSLKVITEQDYIAVDKNLLKPGDMSLRETCPQAGCQATKGLILKASQGDPQVQTHMSQIVKDIVIPQLTKEVNEGANFAQLRQVYNSLILATWYKKKIKDSLLVQTYADQNKVEGVDIADPNEKDKIYARYLEAFKKGTFNMIKDTDMPNGTSEPKKYFSGGFNFAMASQVEYVSIISDYAMKGNTAFVAVTLESVENKEKADAWIKKRRLKITELLSRPTNVLSPREQEVIKLILINTKSVEIAKELKITKQTVNMLKTRAIKKLNRYFLIYDKDNAMLSGQSDWYIEKLRSMPYDLVGKTIVNGTQWLSKNTIKGLDDRALKQYLSEIAQAGLDHLEHLAPFSFGTSHTDTIYEDLMRQDDRNIRSWVIAYMEDIERAERRGGRDQLTILKEAFIYLLQHPTTSEYRIHHEDTQEAQFLRRLVSLLMDNDQVGVISYHVEGNDTTLDIIHPESLTHLIEYLTQVQKGFIQLDRYMDYEELFENLYKYISEQILSDPQDVYDELMNEEVFISLPYLGLGVLYKVWTHGGHRIKQNINSILNRAALDIDSLQAVYNNFAEIIPEKTTMRDSLVLHAKDPKVALQLLAEQFDEDEAMRSVLLDMPGLRTVAGLILGFNLAVNLVSVPKSMIPPDAAVPKIALFSMNHPGQEQSLELRQRLYDMDITQLNEGAKKQLAYEVETYLNINKNYLDQYRAKVGAFSSYVNAHPEIKVVAIEGINRPQNENPRTKVFMLSADRAKDMRSVLTRNASLLWGEKGKEFLPNLLSATIPAGSYFSLVHKKDRVLIVPFENIDLSNEAKLLYANVIEERESLRERLKQGYLINNVPDVMKAFSFFDYKALEQVRKNVTESKMVTVDKRDVLLANIDRYRIALQVFERNVDARSNFAADQIFDSNKHIAVLAGGAHTPEIFERINTRAKAANKPIELTIEDPAMRSKDQIMMASKGGIDLNADKMALDIRNAGDAIQFKVDSVQLAQWRDATGAVPVIIHIKPLPVGPAGVHDLKVFLGIIS